MKSIVITSEHRVGSRWLHYLLADLLDMSTSPEIDANKLVERTDEAKSRIAGGKIVKYHHALPGAIHEALHDQDILILGVVRNPRDRGVSKAFHDFYHPKHNYVVKKKASTDLEAVRWIVLESPHFKEDNNRQVDELMLHGYSTRKHHYDPQLPYVWTSYEWLLDNIELELSRILQLADVPLNKAMQNKLRATIKAHSFKTKTGRAPGKEVRKNMWRRKGTQLDWINWYDYPMMQATDEVQWRYWRKLIFNGGNNDS